MKKEKEVISVLNMKEMVEAEQNNEFLEQRLFDPRRLCLGIFSIIISLILLLVITHETDLFTTSPKTDIWGDWQRLLWIIIFSLISLGVTAVTASFNTPYNDPTFVKNYFFRYFCALAAIDAFVFILLESFGFITNSYLFYFFSGAIVFILVYNIDDVLKDLLGFIRK